MWCDDILTLQTPFPNPYISPPIEPPRLPLQSMSDRQKLDWIVFDVCRMGLKATPLLPFYNDDGELTFKLARPARTPAVTTVPPRRKRGKKKPADRLVKCPSDPLFDDLAMQCWSRFHCSPAAAVIIFTVTSFGNVFLLALFSCFYRIYGWSGGGGGDRDCCRRRRDSEDTDRERERRRRRYRKIIQEWRRDTGDRDKASAMLSVQDMKEQGDLSDWDDDNVGDGDDKHDEEFEEHEYEEVLARVECEEEEDEIVVLGEEVIEMEVEVEDEAGDEEEEEKGDEEDKADGDDDGSHVVVEMHCDNT